MEITQVRPMYIWFIIIVSVPGYTQNYYKYLINGQSLLGETGNIITASPYTVPYKKATLGVHRFSVGFNYGPLPGWEIGAIFDLQHTTGAINLATLGKIVFHSKYHIIRTKMATMEYFQPIDLSVGLRKENIYFVLGKQFPELYDVIIQPSIDFDIIAGEKFDYAVCVSRLTRWANFMLDYTTSGEGQLNLGCRFLLSPKVNLDLFLVDIYHTNDLLFQSFVFGITICI